MGSKKMQNFLIFDGWMMSYGREKLELGKRDLSFRERNDGG